MNQLWKNGFLESRGSFMLDFVCLAMVVIVPLMAASIFLVRNRRQYKRHKRIQVFLGVSLAIAVMAFEIDLRFFIDWQQRAEPSPYFDPNTWSLVWLALVVHLVFAAPTALLWLTVIIQAWRKFPTPPVPAAHSRQHVFRGRLAAFGMLMTAVTGWLFYWLAFVAS